MIDLQLHTHRLENGINGPLAIPAIAELSGLDQWVAWKPVQRGRKVDKPPINPHTGKFADHSDPSDWGSYAQACARGRSCAGVGFVFHPSDPYSGVDLDGCAKPGIKRIRTRDAIEPWALLIIDRCASYTEISPSGKGVKIFVRGTLPATLIHSMGAHIGIEVYSQQRYFTVTGEHLAGTPTAIRDAQIVLEQLWAEYHIETPAVSTQLDVPKSVTTVTLGRISPGEAAAGRASLDDLKARFRAEHTLPSLLKKYGATQKGSSKDWSCPFCEHNHTYTLYIYEGRLFSRSPNCRIPQKKGLDAFGLYVLVEHNNDVVAAAKELNPIARSKSAAPPDLPVDDRSEAERWATQHISESGVDYVLAPEEQARRDAYNQRRRESRRTRAAAMQVDLRTRATTDSGMISQARKMLEAHIHLANLDGQHTWSIAAQAKQAQFSERHAQIGNAYLIEEGYLTRQLRGREETALWTLCYSGVERNRTPQTPHNGVILSKREGSPMLVKESILDSESLAHERGGGAPAARVYASGASNEQETEAQAQSRRLLTGDTRRGGRAPRLHGRGGSGRRGASSGTGLPSAGECSSGGNYDTASAPSAGTGQPAESASWEAALGADRALLSYVRGLAKEAAEPGWALRDYAELDEPALLDEAGRLEGLVKQLASSAVADHSAADVRFCQVLTSPPTQIADGISGEIPQMPNSATSRDSQIENPAELADGEEVRGPGEAMAIVGGAAYVPPGAEGWYQAMQPAALSEVASPAIQIPKILEFADPVEPAALLERASKPVTWSHPVRLLADAPDGELKVSCPPDVSDRRYVTFRKHWLAARQITRSPKQRAWFQQQANRLLEEAEPAEAARRWAPFRDLSSAEIPQITQRRRRAAAPSKPDILSDSGAADQLQLELPMGNRLGKSEIISDLSPGARAAEAIGAYHGPASRPPSQAPAGGR